ncbi:MAG: repair protein RecO protein [Parcubacteria group bacterium GW2011_GWD1_44_9]|nr:MAG: repair protein RecO protein [Parcubacteria group bacterium GW2011_GWD1_44_9]
MLSERPVREADRIYTIMTRDLGLVQATALGVRKEASKLRGALEPFVLSKISLVRGKEHWRVTSAECIQSISPTPTVARPLVLLEKLVRGEASHPELFDAVEEAVLSSELHDEMFEVRIVSKILFHLGYLKESDLSLDKKSLIKAINEGLQASHL